MKNSPESARLKRRKDSASQKSEQQRRRPSVHFPIVGVGASAGGLEAFTQLVRNLPADIGMAFVLVQHLDPAHPSALTEILAKATSLPVREVTNDLPIQPNQVYVIPPNTNMTIARGVLKLQPRSETAGANFSIDFFFQALALDQHERAIGIVLSGAASDGTLGLEAIKAEGGITFAQDETAKYDSMPRSAIAAGCVDFILAPEEMVHELERIAKHPLLAARTLRSSAASPQISAPPIDFPSAVDFGDAEGAFRKILLLLRNQFSVDFSLYKSATLQRRLQRRMVLNRFDTLNAYARFLRQNAKELEALYSDMLINVTSFFRNPEAFNVLRRVVFPKLVPERRDESVRFWVLGCSTGQEAYSLAMAFTEFCDRLPHAPKLQIFATDLNDQMLDKARAGLYPKSLMQGVSPERLRRFFVEQDGGYRVIKPLREAVVFARQNLLHDPPFSHMDLVACRNLLIYIEPGYQKRILPTLHYALKPRGFLFLGASESIGQFTGLFSSADKKHRIYSKKPGSSLPPQMRLLHSHPVGRMETPRPKLPEMPEGVFPELNAQREADRISRNRYAPPGALVDAEWQVLQFRGETSPYLKPAAGQASFNVLKMAREGLLLPLRAALSRVKKENKAVRVENVRVNQNGSSRTVNLEVVPLKNLKERCYLISFETADKPARTARSAPAKSRARAGGAQTARRRVWELEDELNEVRDHLQSLQEQSEGSHEELQASNEEITSANEELQSLNEELETSKEELESANEELTTVNEELANRNVELGRLNSDLSNLQASTRLAILVLGRDLTIRRFTLQAEKQFNLLATDVGRPISNVRHNLDMPELENFIAEVISNVRENEREVRDQQGRWHSLRVLPYLTLDNKVDGAVLVLVDIDLLKRREKEIAAARDYATNIVETIREPLLVLGPQLSVESANGSFYRTFKLTPSGTEGRNIFELNNRQWDIPELRKLLEEILPKHRAMENFEVERDFEGLGRRTMMLNARRIDDPSYMTHRILLAIEDVTARKQTDQELLQARIAEAILATARNPMLILDADLRIQSANDAFYRIFKTSAAETERQSFFELGGGHWKIPRLFALLQDVIPRHSFFDNLEIVCELVPGRRRTFLLGARTLKGQNDKILLDIQDVTEVMSLEAGKAKEGAVITLDREGKIVAFNSAAEKVLGWTHAQAAGKTLAWLIFPPRVRDEGQSALTQCMATAEGPVAHRQIELPAVCADGKEFTAQLSIVANPATQPRLFSALLRPAS